MVYVGLAASERAQLLSTSTLYNGTGTCELEEDGPLHQVVLGSKLPSDATTVAQAGSPVVARSQFLKEYDTGRPTDGTAVVKDQVAGNGQSSLRPAGIRKRPSRPTARQNLESGLRRGARRRAIHQHYSVGRRLRPRRENLQQHH